MHTGKYDLSLQKFQEALDIRISALGPDHVDVSSTQYKMALVHEEKGHMQRALQLCNESLQKAAKVMGNDHPEVRCFLCVFACKFACVCIYVCVCKGAYFCASPRCVILHLYACAPYTRARHKFIHEHTHIHTYIQVIKRRAVKRCMYTHTYVHTYTHTGHQTSGC